MKNLFIIIATCIATISFAQNNFETEMQQAFEHWKSGNEAGLKSFKKIQNNYPTERLPKYYIAFTQTLLSFEKENNMEKENLIDEAKLLIAQLEESFPNHPEILNLKALNLTSEIVLNPMANGMALMEDVNSTYAHALLLEPKNPRTILGQAEFNINAAKFIGGDIKSSCKNVEKALALFETELVDGFEPSWGKERAKTLLNNDCKK